MQEKKFWKIVPHLPVSNLRETINFYKDSLGFSEEWVYGDPPTDGACRRDELRMLFWERGEAFIKQHDLSLVLFVTNVDAVYAEIKQKGLPVYQEIKTHHYGIREFAVLDCNGYMLRFSETVSQPQ
jgi:uncharacterized glyoxalase superfamily protein PhnB